MKVTIAAAPSRAGGVRGVTSTFAGHDARFSRSIRGTAENGCCAGPVGLKKRRPSKWSLVDVIADCGSPLQ
jgi:hypothetical protein